MARQSALACQLLNGKSGVEIGMAKHNAFNLDAKCVFADRALPTPDRIVDVFCDANFTMPFNNDEFDFIISSHIIEHLYNPITSLQEFMRIIKTGGYIFSIIPHKDRTFDRDKPRTTLKELISRNDADTDTQNYYKHIDNDDHYNIWITEDFVELCNYLKFNITHVLDVDDKVGNGFCVVVQK